MQLFAIINEVDSPFATLESDFVAKLICSRNLSVAVSASQNVIAPPDKYGRLRSDLPAVNGARRLRIYSHCCSDLDVSIEQNAHASTAK